MGESLRHKVYAVRPEEAWFTSGFVKALCAALDHEPRLRRLSVYITADLSEPVSQKKAAEFVGLERRYFSTFFHEATGYTFIDWSRSIRMECAKQMLEARATVQEAALAVGYYDLTTFTRAFKKHSGGIAPRAYRQLCLSSCKQSRNREHGEASIEGH